MALECNTYGFDNAKNSDMDTESGFVNELRKIRTGIGDWIRSTRTDRLYLVSQEIKLAALEEKLSIHFCKKWKDQLW